MNTERIDHIQRWGIRAKGQKELIKHLSGERITLKQAVNAHCYDCMGFFADGRVDCESPYCPLYPFMAYNQNRGKRTTNRKLTAEHKQKLIEARL